MEHGESGVGRSQSDVGLGEGVDEKAEVGNSFKGPVERRVCIVETDSVLDKKFGNSV